MNLDFVSAYCLMTNHFHLLLETPKPICPKPCGRSTKRDSVIGKACLEFGYTQAQVALATSLHYSAVSRIVRQEDSRCDPRHQFFCIRP